MKTRSLIILTALSLVFSHLAGASQADDTTITNHRPDARRDTLHQQGDLSGQQHERSEEHSIHSRLRSQARSPGHCQALIPTTTSLTGVLKTRKPVRSFCQSMDFTMDIRNTVTLTYRFLDGSSKQANITITTATFNDPCGYDHPTYLQHRNSAALSYDYILVKGRCSSFSPAIIDTDGALRWVGTAGFSSFVTTFFDNAVYFARGTRLYRNELDGTVTLLSDYSSLGVTFSTTTSIVANLELSWMPIPRHPSNR